MNTTILESSLHPHTMCMHAYCNSFILLQLLLAIKEDRINLTHYTAWSLLDNMEWIAGYK